MTPAPLPPSSQPPQQPHTGAANRPAADDWEAAFQGSSLAAEEQLKGLMASVMAELCARHLVEVEMKVAFMWNICCLADLLFFF